MINIKLEALEDKIKLTVKGSGSNIDLIKECTYLIDSTPDIYRATIDQLPDYAQLVVMSKALESMIDRCKKGVNND